ncbi:hypothetical protein PGT21_031693 [Puccinia graminis f. sp. tritici]|uniref:Secreted protein n=1 Tax=Puccinia graminis f. sp. tritici TaxID=56615 RepID=A0A5B0Q0J0_PUCGR|nr:hypothetical protein PGT21_031693 [Puccinia graminis f. sp. tritici]KAA1086316.1 hypothetical protein PGTUg99_010449 [Puccinia graminis f. sp. tritici]KAA1106721.1 hypothetical protein PGTUg99_014390 [Puccinia graminis f. sp. tritici]
MNYGATCVVPWILLPVSGAIGCGSDRPCRVFVLYCGRQRVCGEQGSTSNPSLDKQVGCRPSRDPQQHRHSTR